MLEKATEVECAGAIYHVTAGGNRREMIFEDDSDRLFPLRCSRPYAVKPIGYVMRTA